VLVRISKQMTHHHDSHADEFGDVVEQLRAHRPEATPLELDAVKRRVRARVAAPAAGRRARSAPLMKSRAAILSMLVAGLLMSTTGAGLAVDGLTGGDDASVSQYPPLNDQGAVLPEQESGGGEEGGGVAGEENAGGPSGDTAPLQPSRQVESGADAGGGELPFTGLAAIPILLGGVALLSTGLILRRRTDT
jgi:hypothetical protein